MHFTRTVLAPGTKRRVARWKSTDISEEKSPPFSWLRSKRRKKTAWSRQQAEPGLLFNPEDGDMFLELIFTTTAVRTSNPILFMNTVRFTNNIPNRLLRYYWFTGCLLYSGRSKLQYSPRTVTEKSVFKCGGLDVSQPYGPPQPVTGITLPFLSHLHIFLRCIFIKCIASLTVMVYSLWASSWYLILYRT
jgi:hypothetical protein